MAEQFDIGHGRVESRRLTSCSILKGYCDWPDCEQVFELERNVILKNTAACRQELVYGISISASCLS